MKKSTVAVLLAAGAGSRFDGDTHKLNAPLDVLPARSGEAASSARSVFQAALANLRAANIGQTIIVTGCLDATSLGLTEHDDQFVVHNTGWAEGQATSITLGLRSAMQLGADVAVIGLGDQPGITPEAWQRVASATAGTKTIAVATYEDKRANPVALGRDVWPLLPTSGDVGARTVMGIHPELVVEVPCPGSPDDIDTAEDLRRWQNS